MKKSVYASNLVALVVTSVAISACSQGSSNGNNNPNNSQYPYGVNRPLNNGPFGNQLNPQNQQASAQYQIAQAQADATAAQERARLAEARAAKKRDTSTSNDSTPSDTSSTTTVIYRNAPTSVTSATAPLTGGSTNVLVPCPPAQPQYQQTTTTQVQYVPSAAPAATYQQQTVTQQQQQYVAPQVSRPGAVAYAAGTAINQTIVGSANNQPQQLAQPPAAGSTGLMIQYVLNNDLARQVNAVKNTVASISAMVSCPRDINEYNQALRNGPRNSPNFIIADSRPDITYGRGAAVSPDDKLVGTNKKTFHENVIPQSLYDTVRSTTICDTGSTTSCLEIEQDLTAKAAAGEPKIHAAIICRPPYIDQVLRIAINKETVKNLNTKDLEKNLEYILLNQQNGNASGIWIFSGAERAQQPAPAPVTAPALPPGSGESLDPSLQPPTTAPAQLTSSVAAANGNLPISYLRADVNALGTEISQKIALLRSVVSCPQTAEDMNRYSLQQKFPSLIDASPVLDVEYGEGARQSNKVGSQNSTNFIPMSLFLRARDTDLCDLNSSGSCVELERDLTGKQSRTQSQIRAALICKNPVKDGYVLRIPITVETFGYFHKSPQKTLDPTAFQAMLEKVLQIQAASNQSGIWVYSNGTSVGQ